MGLCLGALELNAWHQGTRWQPQDINILLDQSSPTRTALKKLWEEFKFVIQYGGIFIGAVALAAAVAQIKTVAKLISDFIVARGPIYLLSSTITQVESSVGSLSKEVDRLSNFEPTMREMAEKIEETFAQIANLQRLTVSERTENSPEETPPTNGRAASPPPPSEEPNWERLRELWNNNGERLDKVIEAIPDKRRRGRFQRMPRTNYPAIINALADEKLISEAARTASLDLHSTFMSYKPRNRKIPDSVVASKEVLDAMLAVELAVSNKDDELPSSPPVDSGTLVPA